MRFARWLVVALALAGAAHAQDNLQLARERMEFRAYGDAFKFIKQELAANPRSWQAYQMLGEYYQRGLSQPEQALQSWLKAWSLAAGRTRLGSEPEEYRQLGETLTTQIQERANAAGDNGQKLLEQVLVEHGFVSLPLIRVMMPRYIQASRWNAVKKILSIVAKQAEADYYRRNEGELAWLTYYEGRALSNTGDIPGAFTKLELAQKKGISEASSELTRLGALLEASALSLMAEAAAAYSKKNYIAAKELYRQVMAKVPAGLPTYERAQTGAQNSEAGIAIEAALQAVETSRQKGDYSTAVMLVGTALQKFPADPRLQERMVELQKLQEKVNQEAEATAEAREKAARDKQILRSGLIAEATALEAKGQFQQAGEKFAEAQKLKKTNDVDQLLAGLQKKYEIQEAYESGTNSYKKRDWASALKSFEKLTEADPTYHDREVRKMMALANFELHQFEKGKDIADKVLARTEDPELLRKMADLSEGNRDSRVEMRRAIEYWKRLDRIAPDGQIETRIKELEWELNKPQAYALATLVAIWLIAFVVMKKKGDWTKKINLNDLERLITKKRWSEACQLHQSIVKSSLSESEELQARQMFARAFFEIGNYQKSISECQHVLRPLPDNKQMKVLLARCLWATKNISPENLQYFFELLETDTKNTELTRFIGEFCLKKRLVTPMTIPLLRTLATMNPEDDGLRQLLIKVYVKENERSQAAFSLYEIERKRNPKNIDVRVILAEDYLRKGEVTRAIQECEEIINIELNHARTHQLLARAYSKLGKIPDLISLYQSLLEQDPHNGAIQGFLAKLMSAEPLDKTGSFGKDEMSGEKSGERSGGDLAAEPAPVAPGSVASAPAPSEGLRSGLAIRPRTQAGAQATPRGAPLSAEKQREMFEKQIESEQPAEAGNSSGVTTRGSVNCPKCGQAVTIGTYFCACGQPL
jgi:tetratricopeptide (TPR) repeat protein